MGRGVSFKEHVCWLWLLRVNMWARHWEEEEEV